MLIFVFVLLSLLFMVIGNVLHRKDGNYGRAIISSSISLISLTVGFACMHAWFMSIISIIGIGILGTSYFLTKESRDLKKFIDQNPSLFEEELKKDSELKNKYTELNEKYLENLNRTIEKAKKLKDDNI